MTPEQLAALAKSITDGVTAGVAAIFKAQKDEQTAAQAALEKADKEKADKDPRPLFKGDISSKEAREAYVAEVRAWELRKAVADGKSADEIAAMFKALDEGDVTDAEAKIEKSDSPEVRDLKRKLAKAERRSKQVAKADNVSTNADEAVAKADEEFALSVANAVNEGRGYTTTKRN